MAERHSCIPLGGTLHITNQEKSRSKIIGTCEDQTPSLFTSLVTPLSTIVVDTVFATFNWLITQIPINPIPDREIAYV